MRIQFSIRIHNELNVALIGPKLDLAYEYKHLGDSPDIIKQVKLTLTCFLNLYFDVWPQHWTFVRHFWSFLKWNVFTVTIRMLLYSGGSNTEQVGILDGWMTFQFWMVYDKMVAILFNLLNTKPEWWPS